MHAKFVHEGGTGLRIQAFLVVRDAQRRVLCLRLRDYDGWMLPGELLLLNEHPDEAARRVSKTWFETPLNPRFAGFFNYPATGPFDKWYLIMEYEADAPKDLKGTEDTLEMRFVRPGEPPGPFAMSHAEVFERIK